MLKWGIELLIIAGLLAGTTARSITQFELTPESTSSSVKSTAPSARHTTKTKQTASASKRFPQVGDHTISPIVGLIWLTVVGGVSVWQGGGRRHAA